jgi:hypothetical protein
MSVFWECDSCHEAMAFADGVKPLGWWSREDGDPVPDFYWRDEVVAHPQHLCPECIPALIDMGIEDLRSGSG